MTTLGVAELRSTRDRGQSDAALDGALLKQTGLLATLVTTRRETTGPSFVGHAELMRLVKSQQSLLSSNADQARAMNDAGAFFDGVRKAA